jgi:hypothetical protein
MSKIRRIHDFQHSFTFSSQTEEFDAFYARFLESDLGKIHSAIPWDELVAAFGLKEAKKGPRCIFSAKGKACPYVPEALRLLFGQASYGTAQREPGLAVFLWHISGHGTFEQF